MSSLWGFWIPVIGVLFFLLIVVLVAINAFYRMVEQGQVLIINSALRSDPAVSFSGAIVVPLINKAEVMDISVKTIEVDRQGTNGLICKDNIRADIKVTFFVRINKTHEDVVRVATTVGVARASDRKTLEDLFQAKFSEALKTVGKRLDFVQLYNERDQFKEEIIKVIGRDLNGYCLEDVAIDYLEQTPLKLLDPDNILDAEGRKKIIELTASQRVKANDIEREAQKTIKKQDVEAREAILALERQQAEAEAKQQREIGTAQARESAERAKVEAEERRRAEEARIQVEQELEVKKQVAHREIEVAGKNREGAVMVENERIQKERHLEQVARERAVELSQIEKEKIIAQERKAIAEVIRERVAVERTVAEEEERIKSTRLVMEAQRTKDAAVIAAEQAAEQARIKEVKLAEAAATAAGFHAKEKLTLAEAEQAAAEKETLAAIRRAEGKQAEAAATGLAYAKVKEADAIAAEKLGTVEARIMEAKAEAERKQGLAKVAVDMAHADATERQGEADASAVENRMLAESKGLHEKAAAMAKITGETRQHEEFRIRLEQEVALKKVQIDAEVQIAQQRAKVLSESLGKAKIEIVGGDGQFFDRFVDAVSMGKRIDATVDHSDVLQTIGKEYLQDGRSLPDDLKEVLSGISSGDLANLGIAGALAKVTAGKDPAKVEKLMGRARELGLLKG
ncbi:MAG: hypothetical protein J0M02_07835 [Planctomycetes bacterium]|nr:hypothetical protein [Planctomycetota bacterium]